MKIKDVIGDDEYIEEADWEDEIEAAILDAEEYGLGFFIVFSDKAMARASFAEVDEVIQEWKRKVALS